MPLVEVLSKEMTDLEHAEVFIASFKQSLKAQVDSLDQGLYLRLYRSLSWLSAASKYANDADMAFINLWIALKALVQNSDQKCDFSSFATFIDEQDQQGTIYSVCWHEYNDIIRALVKNPFLYDEFWAFQRGQSEQHQWQSFFDDASVSALNALSRKQTDVIISIAFERLSILHQQVLDGGATWQSQVNREQIESGLQLLVSLLPHVMVILLEANKPWGEVAYPVVDSF